MPGMTKAEFFDRVAEDGLWRDFSPEDLPKLERLLGRLELAPGMTVFEPGCGSGRLTTRLLEQVSPGGTVIANDISPRMMDLVRGRRLGRRVRRRLGPVEDVVLQHNSVDRVVCFQCFPHFDEKLAALLLFRRALKEDGMLAVVHFAGRSKINRIHHNEQEPICHDLIPTQRKMKTLLRSAGFLPDGLEDSAQGYWLFARPA